MRRLQRVIAAYGYDGRLLQEIRVVRLLGQKRVARGFRYTQAFVVNTQDRSLSDLRVDDSQVWVALSDEVFPVTSETGPALVSHRTVAVEDPAVFIKKTVRRSLLVNATATPERVPPELPGPFSSRAQRILANIEPWEGGLTLYGVRAIWPIDDQSRMVEEVAALLAPPTDCALGVAAHFFSVRAQLPVDQLSLEIEQTGMSRPSDGYSVLVWQQSSTLELEDFVGTLHLPQPIAWLNRQAISEPEFIARLHVPLAAQTAEERQAVAECLERIDDQVLRDELPASIQVSGEGEEEGLYYVWELRGDDRSAMLDYLEDVTAQALAPIGTRVLLTHTASGASETVMMSGRDQSSF